MVTIVFAGIAVADYPAARDWYERLLGRPPDMLPHDTEAAWQFGESGWVYVVLDARRAGSALLTLIVDDLDAVVASIAGRGIAGGAIETIPGAARKAEYTDPDGNRVTFGQPLVD
jgi:catechol 2,3-dioxygenase-like lactoylglutathione lyase family enzyme